jgi:cytochrome c553
MWRERSLAAAALCLAGCTAPVIAPSPPSGEAIAFGAGSGGAADACFQCHGLKGEGDGLAPRLAGQTSGYLMKQMEDYAQRWRDHKDMSPIAARLDDGERIAVAAYYAGLGVHRPGGLRPAASGWALYLDGDPERGLAPCANCHGRYARGVGHGYPALSAQSVEYVSAQLHAFRQSQRRNDPQDVMGAIARKLTPAEIEAISAYVAGLP